MEGPSLRVGREAFAEVRHVKEVVASHGAREIELFTPHDSDMLTFKQLFGNDRGKAS
jgi:hypothetical protein